MRTLNQNEREKVNQFLSTKLCQWCIGTELCFAMVHCIFRALSLVSAALEMKYKMQFKVLYCTVFYRITLYCTVKYCPVMYCTVLYCIVLY